MCPPSEASTREGTFSVRLGARPASVATARRLVRTLLEDADRGDLVPSAELLVSELVTNALLHAGTDIDVSGMVGPNGLLVKVGDGGAHLPARRRYATTAGTGRGLMMLESMVDDWGITRHRHGKTVWFHLSSTENHLDEPTAARAVLAGGEKPSGDQVPVQLENMPLLLHAAWQVHVEALLREYLLATIDDKGSASIQMHAEAIDAIAVLEEHVPAVPAVLGPDVLVDALEPHVSAERVAVSVPRGSVAHFETLDRAIEAALDLSREGLVLAPPSQPEVQTFRRWICREVARQAAGGSPEPWAVPRERPDAVSPPPDWDATTITEAATGVIAADEHSAILAVSRPAADLLGYDPAELVGERLVTIIPERYQQAHLAGFTMYLLVGRRPTLDVPVQVPALRRDGTEVDVELVIHDVTLSGGRSVLLADIRPRD